MKTIYSIPSLRNQKLNTNITLNVTNGIKSIKILLYLRRKT